MTSANGLINHQLVVADAANHKNHILLTGNRLITPGGSNLSFSFGWGWGVE